MNFPMPVTKSFLDDVIKDVADKIIAGDSFEGFIEYLMPTDEIVPPNMVEGYWAMDYTAPDEDFGVKGQPSETLITLTYFKQSLEQQRNRLEERAVKLEDDWGSLEHHQVAEAYGEKNAFDDVLEKLNDLIKGEEMKR